MAKRVREDGKHDLAHARVAQQAPTNPWRDAEIEATLYNATFAEQHRQMQMLTSQVFQHACAAGGIQYQQPHVWPLDVNSSFYPTQLGALPGGGYTPPGGVMMVDPFGYAPHPYAPAMMMPQVYYDYSTFYSSAAPAVQERAGEMNPTCRARWKPPVVLVPDDPKGTREPSLAASQPASQGANGSSQPSYPMMTQPYYHQQEVVHHPLVEGMNPFMSYGMGMHTSMTGTRRPRVRRAFPRNGGTYYARPPGRAPRGREWNTSTGEGPYVCMHSIASPPPSSLPPPDSSPEALSACDCAPHMYSLLVTGEWDNDSSSALNTELEEESMAAIRANIAGRSGPEPNDANGSRGGD